MNVFGSHCDRPTRRPHPPNPPRCLNLWGFGGIATAASPCSSPATSSTNCRSCAGDSCSSKAAGLRRNSPANRSGSRLSSLAGRSVSRNVRRSRLWIRPPSFILILPAVNLFNSDFMKVSGKTGSVSVLDFLAGEFVVQNMLMLPPGSRPAVRERGPHRAPRCAGRRGHGVA